MEQGEIEAKHWHLDKRVNVSHILATAALATSVFFWAGAIDRRVSVMESQIAQAKEDNQRQDHQSNQALGLLREEMRDLRGEIRALRTDLQTTNGKPAR